MWCSRVYNIGLHKYPQFCRLSNWVRSLRKQSLIIDCKMLGNFFFIFCDLNLQLSRIRVQAIELIWLRRLDIYPNETFVTPSHSKVQLTITQTSITKDELCASHSSQILAINFSPCHHHWMHTITRFNARGWRLKLAINSRVQFEEGLQTGARRQMRMELFGDHHLKGYWMV